MGDGDALEVRVANLENERDVAELSQLRFAWRAVERDELGLSEDAFRVAFATWLHEHRTSHVGFLGRLGDEPVAMAWLAIVDRVPGPELFERRCAYVQSVYVSRAYRNGGIGARVMNELIGFARGARLDYLAVHPSQESFSFYRRMGFAGTDHVLELDVRPPRHAYVVMMESNASPRTDSSAPVVARGQRRAILTLLGVVALIILTLYSVLLFGVTSTAVPTGTPQAVVEVVSAQLTSSQQIPANEFRVVANISTVNKYWAMFVVTPTAAGRGKIETTFGYYQFVSHRWQFRAAGRTNVGCASSGVHHVPANVLAGFHEHCSS